MNPVATLELIEVWPNGQRMPAQVQIGTPFREDQGSWACPILITTVDEEVRHIRGADSMQALCLAVRFVGQMLRLVADRGGRLLGNGDGDDDTDFPLNSYFGTGELDAAPNVGPAVSLDNSERPGGPPSVS